MDKQKQIKEIYRLIENTCALVNNCIECQFGKQDKFDCDKLCVANAIYNAGYRKIPENAVVITEEESVKAWKNGNCNAHAIYGLAYEQTRKETAEKFAKRLKEKLNEWLEDNEDDDGKIDFGIAEIELIGVKSLDGEIIAESFIDEICKEFTDKGVQNGN